MIVFDLDGTLALDEHRVHHLRKDPKDWKTYFSLCADDEPNLPVLLCLLALKANNPSVRIGVWTGRSEEVVQDTVAWLRVHGIWNLIWDFRMRPIGNHTDGNELKRQWLYDYNSKNEDQVGFVFEDRQRVVDMWREEGITCLQVAPGAF